MLNRGLGVGSDHQIFGALARKIFQVHLPFCTYFDLYGLVGLIFVSVISGHFKLKQCIISDKALKETEQHQE